MFVVEYSRYTLLSRGNNSSPWSLDKRTVILISVIILPVFLFCITYMTLFGIYEKIIYPNTIYGRDVLQQNLHRAQAYNTYLVQSNSNHDFKHNIRNNIIIDKYKLVCYYNFPSDGESLQAEDLDPFLCTHINVAFGRVVNNSIYLTPSEQIVLKKLTGLKVSTNNELKILLSIGGAGGGSGYPEMVLNHASRKSFIQSVLYYVKEYGIDGIDLDWEFPNEEPGSDKYQRMHFTQLLEELRHCINRQPKYSFLISVAVAATTNIIDNSYDVSYMNDYVDFINLMTYDYHYYTKFTPFTGINSPLYGLDSEKFYLTTLNLNYSTNYWHYLGMDKAKIIVGLPTYGHSFTLANIRNNGLYAPALGFGKLGSQGFVDFTQVCLFLSANHISPVFDMDTKSPYAVKYTEWVSFDDVQSLTYKTEFLRDNNFGGAMVYSLGADDHRGVCKVQGRSNEKFPLTKVVKQVLSNKETSP